MPAMAGPPECTVRRLVSRPAFAAPLPMSRSHREQHPYRWCATETPVIHHAPCSRVEAQWVNFRSRTTTRGDATSVGRRSGRGAPAVEAHATPDASRGVRTLLAEPGAGRGPFAGGGAFHRGSRLPPRRSGDGAPAIVRFVRPIELIVLPS